MPLASAVIQHGAVRGIRRRLSFQHPGAAPWSGLSSGLAPSLAPDALRSAFSVVVPATTTYAAPSDDQELAGITLAEEPASAIDVGHQAEIEIGATATVSAWCCRIPRRVRLLSASSGSPP